MKWKDISSYSRTDNARIPKTFEADVGGLRIVVTRNIYCRPEEWALRCDPWFDMHVVGTGSADEAKAAAVAVVRKQLTAVLSVLRSDGFNDQPSGD